MKQSFKKCLLTLALNEEGSAVLEFVALALPLFIPLFIFLNSFGISSNEQASLRTLSREMARGFVTSENDQVAERVSFEIFSKGAAILGFDKQLSAGSLHYSFQCAYQPCISPNNKVVITVTSDISHTSISSVEYVSPWA